MVRPINELLTLILDNKHRFSLGLCGLVFDLYINHKLSDNEYDKLMNYIATNRPSILSSFYGLKSMFTPADYRFYWPKGKIEPRIKWLKKHIRKNS